MNRFFIGTLFLILVTGCQLYTQENIKPQYAGWAVIGAGCAGISTVGLLLDLGVPADTIIWIDPQFKVGRLGEYYPNVPSNTQTKYFVEFLQCCKTFQQIQTPSIAQLYAHDPEKEYQLKIIVDPLQDITNYLRAQVISIQSNLVSLDFNNDVWQIGIENDLVFAHNVVLATGSHPKTLQYTANATQIPLDMALDKTVLEAQVCATDSIAVIGSAHSAILILKYLSELSVKRIINFYNKPIQYAIENPSGIIIESEAGLKGETARWAMNVLEKNPPAHLIRLFNNPAALDAWLPICNKIIYAIGFERNQLPPINGDYTLYDHYDGSSGIIAPHLFGIGIAFPEKIYDQVSNYQLGIGLNDFIEYAQRILPSWIQKRTTILDKFTQLFHITAL